MQKIGSEISVLGEKGVVVSIDKNAAKDIWKTDLLTIKFADGTTRQIAESLCDNFNPNLYLKNQCNSKTKVDNGKSIAHKIIEIKEKSNDIFKQLNINPQNIKDYQKVNVIQKLFEYIVRNSKYDESIMSEKQNVASLKNMEISDIYNCLCLGRSICTSDASTLAFLLRRCNISAKHITIANKKDCKGVHEVVKINLNNNYFISDPTLVRSALENGQIPNINASVTMFTPNLFFSKIYPQKEEKLEHSCLTL